MASGKHRDLLSRCNVGMYLHHSLNAKQDREEGDLLIKLVAKATATARSILLARLEARIPRFAQME